jgi:phospholipid/cholesterol/gamma-HCH transport system ATP-binding protein
MEQKQEFPQQETPAIEVRGLRKAFGGQQVLNGIDLTAVRGEVLAVLGKSGTGKSVLLRHLVGLEKPDAGSIRINGQEIVNLTMDRLNEVRKKIGFLFQQGALYDSLTIEENVAFPLRRHKHLSDSERKDRVRELLASVGLDGDLEKMPSQISGGMRKRVGMARAMALDPELILFDEPTAGLDPITAAEFGKMICDLKGRRHMTAIMVTHDVHGARSVADRLVMLNAGNIVITGTFDDLQKSEDPFVKDFLKYAA